MSRLVLSIVLIGGIAGATLLHALPVHAEQVQQQKATRKELRAKQMQVTVGEWQDLRARVARLEARDGPSRSEVPTANGFARRLKVAKVNDRTFQVTMVDKPFPDPMDMPVLGRYGRGWLALDIEGIKKGEGISIIHGGDSFITAPWPDRPAGDPVMIDLQQGAVESIVQSVNTPGDGFQVVFPNDGGKWQVRSATIMEWDGAYFTLPVDPAQTTSGGGNPPHWYEFVIPLTGMPVLHGFPLKIAATFTNINAKVPYTLTLRRNHHMQHDITDPDRNTPLIVQIGDAADLLARSDTDNPQNPGNPIATQSEPLRLTIMFPPDAPAPDGVALSEITISIDR